MSDYEHGTLQTAHDPVRVRIRDWTITVAMLLLAITLALLLFTGGALIKGLSDAGIGDNPGTVQSDPCEIDPTGEGC
jgi:hypothetical protein